MPGSSLKEKFDSGAQGPRDPCKAALNGWSGDPSDTALQRGERVISQPLQKEKPPPENIDCVI